VATNTGKRVHTVLATWVHMTHANLQRALAQEAMGTGHPVGAQRSRAETERGTEKDQEQGGKINRGVLWLTVTDRAYKTSAMIRTKNNNQNHHCTTGMRNELGNEVWTAPKITAQNHEWQKNSRAENSSTIQQKETSRSSSTKIKREKIQNLFFLLK
jgi:hypothetical protein